jgi:hypothetical protein
MNDWKERGRGTIRHCSFIRTVFKQMNLVIDPDQAMRLVKQGQEEQHTDFLILPLNTIKIEI